MDETTATWGEVAGPVIRELARAARPAADEATLDRFQTALSLLAREWVWGACDEAGCTLEGAVFRAEEGRLDKPRLAGAVRAAVQEMAADPQFAWILDHAGQGAGR